MALDKTKHDDSASTIIKSVDLSSLIEVLKERAESSYNGGGEPEASKNLWLSHKSRKALKSTSLSGIKTVLKNEMEKHFDFAFVSTVSYPLIYISVTMKR